MRITFIVTFVALGLTACASRQHRDATGRLELNPNQLEHTKDAPYFCFSFAGNGQERHECSVSEASCQQRTTARTEEKFQMTGACRPGDAVFCFAWAEGEMTHSQCYETEPDCTEVSAEIAAKVSKENVSACQHFDRTHQSF